MGTATTKPLVGLCDGAAVGDRLGYEVGNIDGNCVGGAPNCCGLCVGATVGDKLGVAVGHASTVQLSTAGDWTERHVSAPFPASIVSVSFGGGETFQTEMQSL